MKITAAIPCYNLQNRISVCLESLIAQDYKNIEILIIDDCSTDNSVEVINCFIDLHPEREFRLIVNEKNLGLSEVRNLAINEASGEALYFLDGDDTIEPETLSLLQQRMKETNAEIVCGSYRKKDINGNSFFFKQYPEDTIKGEFALATYLRKYINGSFRVAVWNILYNLDFLRTHDICCSTHYRTYESSLFTFKVALYARNVSYIHDITYNQFSVPTSISHQKKDLAFLHTVQAVIISVFDERCDYENRHKNQIIPPAILFMLSNICLTNGLLKKAMEADVNKNEKKIFLRWLKGEFHKNNMKWGSVVGIYNKISYMLLFSPFPYLLFRLYFSHLKAISKVVEYYIKIAKQILNSRRYEVLHNERNPRVS